MDASETHPTEQARLIRLLAFGLAAATLFAHFVLPAGRWFSLAQDLLLLCAFALPAYPLIAVRRTGIGSGRAAWSLLLVGSLFGLGGHFVWLGYRLSTAGSDPGQLMLPELGYAGWVVLTALALALEVSSGDRGSRAELVADLLLIGSIGLILAREIFASLAPLSGFADPFDLTIGTTNVVASLALAVTALGVLMSPEALGGGVPRMLVALGGFVGAVARLTFAYRLMLGAATPWQGPAWILALALIAVGASQRSAEASSGQRREAGSTPVHMMVVPVIVAYGLSLLIRELLVTGQTSAGARMAWAALAVLVVARVAVGLFGARRHGREVSAWEDRYKTVVSALGDVVYEWELDTNTLLRSGNTLQVFGVEADALDSGPVFVKMHPDDREETERAVWEAVGRGGWFELEYRILHANGEWRLIRDRGFCQHDEHDRPVRVLGLMSDITEERQSQQRLQHAERLASLGVMAAGAAHEINNPLAAIKLAAQMMLEDDRLPDDVQDDAATIARQATRAGEITERMLVFARKREGERTAVHLNGVVGDVLRARRYELATHGIQLDEELAEGLPATLADAGQIERALLNLVVNAEHALTELPEGKRLLTVRTRKGRGRVEVQIVDNGPGIAPTVLPNIFDPFFTTREVGKGTGLGLSICYSIAQSHGGDLRVETLPRRGTTFTLELPFIDEQPAGTGEDGAAATAVRVGEAATGDARAVGAAAQDTATSARAGGGELRPTLDVPPDAPEATHAERRPTSGAGPATDDTNGESEAPVQPRVLVVDDEESVRELARKFLAQRGYRVEEAASGRRALELLTRESYDSIILDLRMPDLSGEGLYEWLRRNRPEMARRITMVSGDFANPKTQKVIQRIGRPCLRKPFDPEELLSRVEHSAVRA